MPILQPLPLRTQDASSSSSSRPAAMISGPRAFPSPSSWDPKDRLCWVHRVSKSSHQQYLWPAVYYVNWSEACHELSQVLTPEENKELCFQLYVHAGASAGNVSSTTAVAKILLGTSSSSSSSSLSTRDMEFVEIPAGSDAVFGQFFGGYFAQAMQTASHPSCFEHDQEWQREFRHAVDQAVSLSKGETTLVTTASSSSSSPIMMPAADANHEDTPSEAPAPQEAPQGLSLSSPSAGLTTISPSSSSQHETPTRSNKLSNLTIMEEQEKEKEQQQPKEPQQEQRTLLPRSPNTTRDDDSLSSAAATTTLALTKVTPCRPSSRSSRRKTVPKNEGLTPTCSKPTTQSYHKRRHDDDAVDDNDDDDDEFYSFKPLIALLTKEFKWSYRSARDWSHSWVYVRPGKNEKNGTFLEDFFYEEHQVVDYCKANNYKQLVCQHRLLQHDSNQNENNKDDALCITPSPHKKSRFTTA